LIESVRALPEFKELEAALRSPLAQTSLPSLPGSCGAVLLSALAETQASQRIVVIAPGPVDTPLLRKAVDQGGEKLLEAMKASTLLGRLGTPEEVAAAVVFLASDAAAFITGEVIGVSGGMGCGQ